MNKISRVIASGGGSRGLPGRALKKLSGVIEVRVPMFVKTHSMLHLRFVHLLKHKIQQDLLGCIQRFKNQAASNLTDSKEL